MSARGDTVKKIYVCSRLAGDIENNIEKAKCYARFVVKERGAIPIAPHIYFTQFLDDTLPEDRAFGTRAGLMLLSAAACTPTPETPDTTDTQGDTTVETPTEAPTETPTEPTTEAPTEEETEAPKPERTVTNM